MREWFARQYEDVRGNFKWGLLMLLWWALTTYGKKVLSLIPSMSLWAVNVGLFMLALIGFMWIATLMARSPQETKENGLESGTEEDDTDYKQLFLSEQESRNKHQEEATLAKLEIERLKRELAEIYSDAILFWLKKNCHTFCTFSADDMAVNVALSVENTALGLSRLQELQLLTKDPLCWKFSAANAVRAKPGYARTMGRLTFLQ